MNIAKNKVVSVHYELRVNGTDGELVESTLDHNPLTFIYGVGSMLPKFESNIGGMQVGDAFDFTLLSDDAYGPVEKESIVELEKNVFKVDGVIKEDLFELGKIVPMQDNQGNMFNGRIIEVKKDSVLMDFNHPLAGEDLSFKGTVIDVREATAEELSHGHIHGGGCEGCEPEGDSCGCGNEGNKASCGCGCN